MGLALVPQRQPGRVTSASPLRNQKPTRPEAAALANEWRLNRLGERLGMRPMSLSTCLDHKRGAVGVRGSPRSKDEKWDSANRFSISFKSDSRIAMNPP